MAIIIKEQFPQRFTEILKNIHINFHDFPLNRCDERTIYISTKIQNRNHSVICDFIFLMDRPELFGAISLNDKYENARNFFKDHFNYTLLYSDELLLANHFMKTSYFKKCLQEFSNHYSKHFQSKFLY